MKALQIMMMAKGEWKCGDDITFTYRGSSVTYGTVERDYGGGNVKCWMDRNLGASRKATSSADSQSYGDLFQWGRLDDGHQDRESDTTSTRATSNTPGHDDFITHDSSPNDWRNPQNDDLWQGEDGVNNPCPDGWRVPTEAELNAEINSWTSQNSAGAYASTLKWSVAGYRGYSGSLNDVGSYGYVWGSTVSSSYSCFIYFYSSGIVSTSTIRANGFSVRCIRD
jgi:uncharacterized protein (TIGR02145 family)